MSIVTAGRERIACQGVKLGCVPPALKHRALSLALGGLNRGAPHRARARQGSRGGGVALYVRECFDCLELDVGEDRVECLWVRIRGKANKASIMVGVCYRPPNQDEEADEIFCQQLGEVSRLLALVLVGDFSLPDVCWKYNTTDRKQSRRFLECMEDNLLTQLVREPAG